MALQSSGTITMNDIMIEFDLGLQAASLKEVSEYVGFTVPHAISEFYGYSYDPITSFSTTFRQASQSSACSASQITTYYHDGGFGGIQVGVNIRTNSAFTVFPTVGWYGTGVGAIYIDDFGKVSGSIISC